MPIPVWPILISWPFAFVSFKNSAMVGVLSDGEASKVNTDFADRPTGLKSLNGSTPKFDAMCGVTANEMSTAMSV